MSNMAEVLTHINSLTQQLYQSNGDIDRDYGSRIHDLLIYLKQVVSDEASNRAPHDNSMLDKLDPSFHSISYLFIWHRQVSLARSKSNESFPEEIRPGGELWSRGVALATEFDPIQMRFAGREWCELLEILGESALSVSKPLLALQPTRDAIIRLDPSCAVFTSTHTLFVKLCLHAKVCAYALPILDKPLCYFPSETEQTLAGNRQHLSYACYGFSPQFTMNNSGFSANITYREHLEYFLYGAMIYMILKDWEKALHFLTVVVSCPVVNSVSMIMVEAYKKWILVNLLRNGKLNQAPGTMSSYAVRICRSLAKPYIALAEAFESGDMLRLEAEVEIAWSVWRMDNNGGIVLQVIRALEEYAIHKLSKTFAALTVADATERASGRSMSSSNMESVIASLIMSRSLKATLSHLSSSSQSAMLRFSGVGSRFGLNESYVEAQLAGAALSMTALMDHIGDGNYGLEMSREHVESLAKNPKQVGAFKGNMNIANEACGLDIEEDIME